MVVYVRPLYSVNYQNFKEVMSEQSASGSQLTFWAFCCLLGQFQRVITVRLLANLMASINDFHV